MTGQTGQDQRSLHRLLHSITVSRALLQLATVREKFFLRKGKVMDLKGVGEEVGIDK